MASQTQISSGAKSNPGISGSACVRPSPANVQDTRVGTCKESSWQIYHPSSAPVGITVADFLIS